MSKERQELLYHLLMEVKQPWSDKLFEIFNGMIPFTGIEAIFLRRNIDKIEILLPKRSKKDNTWPNQPAVPGSIVRDTDITPGLTSDGIDTSILHRIFVKELKMSRERASKVRTINYGLIKWRHKRGGSISDCFICIGKDIEFSDEDWYMVDTLPTDLLEGHEVVIKKALDYIKDNPEILPRI